jgi:CelD/BcsL family acetyltransferase involved in cellulose biosynthesis
MGAGYEEMAGGWKKSHRNDVQRQARRLAERGTLTLACPAGPDTVRGHLAAFLAMHARTWRTKGQSLRKRNEELAGFFERLIDELWAESHFSMLCVDGDPVSYHFGFLHAGRFYWYKPAYDQAYENLSPGKVHIAKLIKLGAEQGWQAFDFLTGAEPYKYAWTGDERHTVDLSWRNPTLRSSVSGALGSARPGLGRLLRSIRRARAR